MYAIHPLAKRHEQRHRAGLVPARRLCEQRKTALAG